MKTHLFFSFRGCRHQITAVALASSSRPCSVYPRRREEKCRQDPDDGRLSLGGRCLVAFGRRERRWPRSMGRMLSLSWFWAGRRTFSRTLGLGAYRDDALPVAACNPEMSLAGSPRRRRRVGSVSRSTCIARIWLVCSLQGSAGDISGDVGIISIGRRRRHRLRWHSLDCRVAVRAMDTRCACGFMLPSPPAWAESQARCGCRAHAACARCRPFMGHVACPAPAGRRRHVVLAKLGERFEASRGPATALAPGLRLAASFRGTGFLRLRVACRLGHDHAPGTPSS